MTFRTVRVCMPTNHEPDPPVASSAIRSLQEWVMVSSRFTSMRILPVAGVLKTRAPYIGKIRIEGSPIRSDGPSSPGMCDDLHTLRREACERPSTRQDHDADTWRKRALLEPRTNVGKPPSFVLGIWRWRNHLGGARVAKAELPPRSCEERRGHFARNPAPRNGFEHVVGPSSRKDPHVVDRGRER